MKEHESEHHQKLETILLQAVVCGNHRPAQQFLPNNYKVNQLRADYRKAAKLGDIITPMISNVDGVYTVVLANSDGNPYTTLEFK